MFLLSRAPEHTHILAGEQALDARLGLGVRDEELIRV